MNRIKYATIMLLAVMLLFGCSNETEVPSEPDKPAPISVLTYNTFLRIVKQCRWSVPFNFNNMDAEEHSQFIADAAEEGLWKMMDDEGFLLSFISRPEVSLRQNADGTWTSSVTGYYGTDVYNLKDGMEPFPPASVKKAPTREHLLMTLDDLIWSRSADYISMTEEERMQLMDDLEETPWKVEYSALDADSYGRYVRFRHIDYPDRILQQIFSGKWQLQKMDDSGNTDISTLSDGDDPFPSNEARPCFSPDHFLYRKTKDGLGYEVYSIRDIGNGNIVMPNEIDGLPILEIADKTFQEISNIKTIVFPHSLRRIGEKAMYNCIGIKHLDIPPTVKEIGENAFRGCRLSSVTFPNRLERIGTGAFLANNITEITIPAGVVYVGGYAFKNRNDTVKVTVLQKESATATWAPDWASGCEVVYSPQSET